MKRDIEKRALSMKINERNERDMHEKRRRKGSNINERRCPATSMKRDLKCDVHQ